MSLHSSCPSFHHILSYLACCLIVLNSQGVFSQQDEDQILQLRTASNQAMKAYDHQKVLSFLTEDVLTTTGNGTLLTGKAALAEYIEKNAGNKMYFVRTPDQVRTGSERAWEQGTWMGYDPEKGPDPIVGGAYAAMWVKTGGRWLIKSQLFVTLE